MIRPLHIFILISISCCLSPAQNIDTQEKAQMDDVESILTKEEKFHKFNEQNEANVFKVKMDPMEIILEADDDLKPVDKPPPPKINTIDQVHRSLSRNIFFLTNSIDQFFVNEKELDKDNGTRLRIFSTHSLVENVGTGSDLSFRFRLRLPYLTEKLHLAIEQRDQDIEARNQTADSLEAIDTAPVNDNIQAGVGFIEKDDDIFSFRVTGGLRFNKSPYPFYKVRFFRDFYFGNDYEINTSLSVYWDEEDQYSEVFYIDINKKLTNGIIVRWVNEQRWADTDDTLRTKHGPTFFYQLSPRRFISYYARVFTRNRPNFQTENYRLGVAYRQRIYKKWVFYELSPFIDFPRREQFTPINGIIFKLEAVLGEIY